MNGNRVAIDKLTTSFNLLTSLLQACCEFILLTCGQIFAHTPPKEKMTAVIINFPLFDMLGDIWIVSKSIDFEPSATFVAKSAFFGPSSNGDLEIEPVSGYSPSNWRSGDTVHAIWACNAGTELSCIQNLDEHVTLQHLPLLTYLLNGYVTS